MQLTTKAPLHYYRMDGVRHVLGVNTYLSR